LSFVGIIANPASGKDIRRVVSHATVVNNHEKVSIVRRVLLSLYASGVRRVEIMPDHFGIGSRALDGLRNHPEILAGTSLIDMPFEGTADDSLRAAQYLCDAGAGCIVILGGDGTCRVVAKGLALSPLSLGQRTRGSPKGLALSLSKGCGDVPLLPISTGTNNVVPTFIEGTVAGQAAAYVALHPGVERERFCYRHKRLLVYVNGEEVDQALVEVVLVSTCFVGARAIWQAESLRQVFVTRAQPVHIGISSIIGMVHPVAPSYPGGAAVTIVPRGRRVMVPLAPGSLVAVSIGEIVDLKPGVRYPVSGERPAVLALDGEREITLCEGEEADVKLELDGPWIVDVERTLLLAVAEGAFFQGEGTQI
jgi:predicted polyphosphate/ATP-dependent NAD kinase